MNDRIHIASPTLNRAALYAAGLGLSDAGWKMIGANSEGARGDCHILPGASDDDARIAARTATKSATTRLVDHRPV